MSFHNQPGEARGLISNREGKGVVLKTASAQAKDRDYGEAC